MYRQPIPPPPAKRHPLQATHVNHHHQPPTPPKGQHPPPTTTTTTMKPPGSPPLPRQNSKTRPPSPPKVISDKGGRLHFNRVGFLGEGGFARVYEVKDPKGTRLACKVVTKSALKTKKAKTKLYAEIKIHRSLDHPNIVTFQDCFEDDDNVYITLDLCPSGSMMDMLRRRRRFTEPETRFFMVQLIGACHYMHAHQVIHRDLKLGNLFLDGAMNVQVGDFGLAALIENPGERKKTICGTPNYIAPEVLFDTANGHSFEVDIWSIGVILYTLVVGRPPFQTKEVKEIYKRIRDNEYEFPVERHISSAVKHLISEILTPDPSQRPTLHEIVDHPFFVQGPVPEFVPMSAHDGPPDFRHITKSQSEANLRRLRKDSLLDVDFSAGPVAASAQPVAPAKERERAAAPSRADTRDGGRTMTSSIAQQEKEFQKAVQPGSPISALLSSARTPLMVGPSAPGGGMGGARESPLFRKLQAAAGGRDAAGPAARVGESPLGRRSVTRGADGGYVESDGAGLGRGGSLRRRGNGGGEGEEDEEERVRKKELEAQKARIVAQMAPVKEEEDEERSDVEEEDGDDEGRGMEVVEEEPEEQRRERPLPALPVSRAGKERERERGGARRYNGDERENVPPVSTIRMVSTKDTMDKGKEPVKPSAQPSTTRERHAERERERDLGKARERLGAGLVASGSTASLNRLAPAAKIGTSRMGSASAVNLVGSSAPSSSSKLNLPSTAATTSSSVAQPPSSSSSPPTDQKLNGFDAAAQMLTAAFEAKAAGRVFRRPDGSAWGPVEEERVFIVSWVDYCNKYGMGYALTDGSVGVHFNDSTSLVLSGGKGHFDYIASRRQGTVYVRKSYSITEYPEELKSKVYLLKHFEKYIMERLYGEYEYTYVDTERERGMEWVQKYLRMKHVIVFKMSHDVLQFNFYDHSKLILSSHGLHITHIDKHYQKTTYNLVDLLKFAMDPPRDATPDEVRVVGRVVDKLKYCKEVLGSIKSAAAAEGGEGGEKDVKEGKETREGRGDTKERGERERERGEERREKEERGHRRVGSKVSLR